MTMTVQQQTTPSLMRTFRALGEPRRFTIVTLLAKGQEMCVSDIAAALDMSTPAASHHLRILSEAELLIKRRVGQTTYFTPARNHPAIALVKEKKWS